MQEGRFGRLEAIVSCTGSRNGTATFSEIEANRSGFRAKFRLRFASGCTESGRIAGVRRLGSP